MSKNEMNSNDQKKSNDKESPESSKVIVLDYPFLTTDEKEIKESLMTDFRGSYLGLYQMQFAAVIVFTFGNVLNDYDFSKITFYPIRELLLTKFIWSWIIINGILLAASFVFMLNFIPKYVKVAITTMLLTAPGTVANIMGLSSYCHIMLSIAALYQTTKLYQYISSLHDETRGPISFVGYLFCLDLRFRNVRYKTKDEDRADLNPQLRQKCDLTRIEAHFCVTLLSLMIETWIDPKLELTVEFIQKEDFRSLATEGLYLTLAVISVPVVLFTAFDGFRAIIHIVCSTPNLYEPSQIDWWNLERVYDFFAKFCTIWANFLESYIIEHTVPVNYPSYLQQILVFTVTGALLEIVLGHALNRLPYIFLTFITIGLIGPLFEQGFRIAKWFFIPLFYSVVLIAGSIGMIYYNYKIKSPLTTKTNFSPLDILLAMNK
ncbi:hypothetical protein ACOME3_003765 [Neoechinorhynchus agilis]